MSLKISIIIGCVLGAIVPLSPGVSVLAALGSFALVRKAKGALKKLAIAIGTLLVVAVFSSALSKRPLVSSPDGIVNVEGTAARIFCEDSARCSVWLVDVTLDGFSLEHGMSVKTLAGDLEGTHIGDRFRLEAKVESKNRSRNPGMGMGIGPPRIAWYAKATGDWNKIGFSARIAQLDRLRELLAFENQGATALYRALLLGDKSRLTTGTKDAFIDTGTAHILAISGLHLAVIAYSLYRLILFFLVVFTPLGSAHRPSAVAATVALSLVWLYVVLVARTPATIRAALVISLVLGGIILSRRTRPSDALVLAAMVILCADPFQLFTPSFVLSFTAASALVAARHQLKALVDRCDKPGEVASEWLKNLGRKVLPLWGVSWVAGLATAPVSLAFFGTFSISGLWVNLVAVPWVTAFVVPVGFFWLLLAMLSPEIAGSVSFVPEFGAEILCSLIEIWGGISGSSQQGAWPHVVGISLSVLFVVALKNARSARRAFLIVIPIIVLWNCYGDRAGGVLDVHFLDVGHGDAIVIQSPEGGAMMVDTGGSRKHKRSNDTVANRTLIPALARLGIGSLDRMVITHGHADHVGAARRIAERIHVRELWLSSCGLKHPALKPLIQRVRATGGKIRVKHAGDGTGWQGVRIDVLWPPQDEVGPDDSCEMSDNNGSLVLKLTAGKKRLLLTGDLEAEGEESLVERGALLASDLLKSPHHGSKSSSTHDFLDRVKAPFVVVSGRYREGFMPPHRHILSRYQRRKMLTYRTGSDGAISMRVGAGGTMKIQGTGSGRSLLNGRAQRLEEKAKQSSRGISNRVPGRRDERKRMPMQGRQARRVQDFLNLWCGLIRIEPFASR